MLKRLGHKGISISNYCFDRALFSTLERKQLQRHALYHEPSVVGAEKVGARALDDLQDWVVCTACANHDAQNALKWSLMNVSSDVEVVHKLHIIIESLRNSFDLILDRLAKFVADKLRFDDGDYDRGDAYRFWVTLGVRSDVADVLADLNLSYEGGYLRVHVSHVGSAGLYEKITGAMLVVFKFKRFTDSRWVTVGDCCRSLLAAQHVGLEGLVRATREDPKASDYYLHGFAEFTSEVKKYVAVASLSANVSDAALLELLHDDRVALRAGELQRAMHEELLWLGRIDDTTWDRLAAVIDGVSGPSLRSLCLQAGHVSSAFFNRRVLVRARGYPWVLCHGDIDAKLDALLLRVDVHDDTTTKIQRLLKAGVNKQRIACALRLMGDVSWSTTVVEQGHGSAAVVHRTHRLYGPLVLSSRSMLHMMRCLLPGSPTADKEMAQKQKKVAQLEAKAPGKVQGRHVFYRELLRSAQEVQEGVALRASGARMMLKAHGGLWARLGDADKEVYERMARQEVSAKRVKLDEDLSQAELEVLVLKNQGLAEERLEESKQTRLSRCKLTDVDMENMAVLWNSKDFGPKRVASLRAEQMVAPEPPALVARTQLEDMHVQIPIADGVDAPSWIDGICANRGIFQHCALFFQKNGEEVAFAFLYAVQQPRSVSLLVLEQVDEDLPHLPSGCSVWDFAQSRNDYEFVVCRRYAREVDVKADEGSAIMVLPGLFFRSGDRMASHCVKVPLDSYVRGLPTPSRSSAEPTSSRTERASASADMLARFPWLSQYMEAAQPIPMGATASEVKAPREPTAGDDLPEEVVDAAFEVLEAKRRRWAEEYVDAPPDFCTSILGRGMGQEA